MTEQEEVQQRAHLVWEYPPPNLSIKTRPTIPTHAFWDIPVTFARRDMLREVEHDGIHDIPVLLAAPMYVLLRKHEEELEKNGPDGSFISKIEFPARMKPSRTKNLDFIYGILKEAPSLQSGERLLNGLPTRLIFEILALIVQQMDLKFKMSAKLTEFMLTVDFGAPYFWNPEAGKENAFKKYMEDKNLGEDELMVRLSNKVADIWATELESTEEKPAEKLQLRFILTNLSRIVGSYFRALNNHLPNDRHLPIKVNKDPNSRTNSQMQVLGLKFGRFLATLDADTLKSKYPNSVEFTHFQGTLPATVIKNLLLLNTPEAFMSSPKASEYLFHDKEGCNFENPECACQHKSME